MITIIIIIIIIINYECRFDVDDCIVMHSDSRGDSKDLNRFCNCLSDLGALRYEREILDGIASAVSHGFAGGSMPGLSRCL